MKKIIIFLLYVIVSINSYSQNDFSLLFTSSSHEVEIPANSNFDNVIDSLTICAWIKPVSIQSGVEGSAIIARRDYVGTATAERNHFMFSVKDDLSLRFLSQNNSSTLYSTNAVTTDSVVNYGVWNFVSVTFYKGLVKIYSNGNLVYNVDHGVKELFPYNHLISIGKVKRFMHGDSFAQFGGMLDEVSIWHDNLSDSLINQYMNCPPLGTESNLLAYWKFEEGINNIANDETGNGNDGTLSLGTQWFTDVPSKFCTCNTSLFPTYYKNSCDSIILHGKTYYTSQIVIDTVPTTFGCDSIITTDFIINNSDSTFIDTTISHNQTLYAGGAIQNTGGIYYDILKTINGCDSVIVTNLSKLPVGLSNEIKSGFSFSPNPTKGIVTINSNFIGRASIINLQGQNLISISIVEGSNVINLSELPQGTYFLMFETQGGILSSMLIKE